MKHRGSRAGQKLTEKQTVKIKQEVEPTETEEARDTRKRRKKKPQNQIQIRTVFTYSVLILQLIQQT